jgi:hypothetical protein
MVAFSKNLEAAAVQEVCGTTQPAPAFELESCCMDLVMKVLAPVLEWLFFIGMAGSFVVILISAIDDIHTILQKD